MNSKDLRTFKESYNSIYDLNENVKEMYDNEKEIATSSLNQDMFDIILEYLVAEGYADTNQAAIAIMANMSEEWKRSIMEGDALTNTIKTLEAKRDAMNKQKPGSANQSDYGKQSVGAATYAAYQRLRGV